MRSSNIDKLRDALDRLEQEPEPEPTKTDSGKDLEALSSPYA
jgi:hypothetical protein